MRLLVNQERTLISALVWLSLMGLDLPLIILYLFVAVVVVIEVLVFLLYIQINVQSRCSVYVHSLVIFFHGLPLFARGYSISAFHFIYF